MLKLFWEYTRTNRFHWIDDGGFYGEVREFSKVYEHRRWAIVDGALNHGWDNIHRREHGYDLWHMGIVIKHATTVKELKAIVIAEETKLGNKVFNTYGEKVWS